MANSSLVDFHELVIGVQVHAVILQSVEPMNDMRATSIDIAISILILDSVRDILLVLEKISQVRGRLVQPSSHLHIHPTGDLSGLLPYESKCSYIPLYFDKAAQCPLSGLSS